jgi:hypothetical protein
MSDSPRHSEELPPLLEAALEALLDELGKQPGERQPMDTADGYGAKEDSERATEAPYPGLGLLHRSHGNNAKRQEFADVGRARR